MATRPLQSTHGRTIHELAGFFTTPEELARQVSAAVYRREVTNRLGTITEGGSLRKVVARASVADNLARIFVESLDRARA